MCLYLIRLMIVFERECVRVRVRVCVRDYLCTSVCHSDTITRITMWVSNVFSELTSIAHACLLFFFASKRFCTNGGQICTAHTRLIVHEKIKAPLLAKLKERCEALPFLDNPVAEVRLW